MVYTGHTYQTERNSEALLIIYYHLMLTKTTTVVVFIALVAHPAHIFSLFFQLRYDNEIFMVTAYNTLTQTESIDYTIILEGVTTMKWYES